MKVAANKATEVIMGELIVKYKVTQWNWLL
jgi:hypothetical protein